MNRLLFCLFLIFSGPIVLQAGPEEDWAVILKYDAGPSRKPGSREEAAMLARNHFFSHRQALEKYLARYPQGPHAFDAKLKLAAVIAAQGMMDNDQAKVQQALRLYTSLETDTTAPRERRADAGFQRAGLSMQAQQGDTAMIRDGVVLAARNFVAKYPGDRRGPRLLVEAATTCDDTPTLKRELLELARAQTTEEALKLRIDDDLKRLDLLGKPFSFKASNLTGGTIDIEALRGQVVVIIFWSADSPHSLIWLRKFRADFDRLPRAGLQVVTVSLDENRKTLTEKLSTLQVRWPTHNDGKGWNGPLVRSLGINALPAVWIVDKKGVLRTLNARDDYDTWIRKLSRE